MHVIFWYWVYPLWWYWCHHPVIHGPCNSVQFPPGTWCSYIKWYQPSPHQHNRISNQDHSCYTKFLFPPSLLWNSKPHTLPKWPTRTLHNLLSGLSVLSFRSTTSHHSQLIMSTEEMSLLPLILCTLIHLPLITAVKLFNFLLVLRTYVFQVPLVDPRNIL